ncbi:hypothetical protein TNCV_3309991 [Trichonephila clavipes]|nr:hypothetical protein TNCV_3309991 [Trichonephila clavipes]
MNSSQHRYMNQAPASENQMQQRSLNSSLEATVGSPLVHLVGMLLNGSTSSLPNSPLQPSVTSITYGPWYTTFATSLILDGPILPCTITTHIISQTDKKRPESDNDGSLLHQDSAFAHMALSVRQFLTSKNITVKRHPPYSPDLAPM